MEEMSPVSNGSAGKFSQQQMPRLQQSTRQQRQLHCKRLAKLPSTSEKLTSCGAPDAAGVYASQYAKKIKKQAGKCATTPFLRSQHIFGTMKTFWGEHHTAGGGYLLSTRDLMG
jgi:hypothetical protein